MTPHSLLGSPGGSPPNLTVQTVSSSGVQRDVARERVEERDVLLSGVLDIPEIPSYDDITEETGCGGPTTRRMARSRVPTSDEAAFRHRSSGLLAVRRSATAGQHDL